jgi:hypothetical protein
MYSAFMPTTPNPTSGFLFFVYKEEVTILDLSVEDGAKLVISAGLVSPDRFRKHDNVLILDREFAEAAAETDGVETDGKSDNSVKPDKAEAGKAEPGKAEAGKAEPGKAHKPARKKVSRRQGA